MEELVRTGFCALSVLPAEESRQNHCSVLHLSGNGLFKTLEDEECRRTAGLSDIPVTSYSSSFTALWNWFVLLH